MQIEILERTGNWAAVVKPAGISSEQDGMGRALAETLKISPEEVYPVHRLDREVGGVMVYALTKEAAAFLSAASSDRRMRKTYLALIQGVPEAKKGRWEDLLFHDRSRNKTYPAERMRKGVKQAVLDYRLIGVKEDNESGTALSLLEITLQTGRTHQIRAQCASRGMPVAGDRRYGGRGKNGICLFAWKLSFPDPRDGAERSFELPVPSWAMDCWPDSGRDQ